MGAMTMEFSLPNTKMLSLVKPGDKVLFAAQQVKSEYVVTHIVLLKKLVLVPAKINFISDQCDTTLIRLVVLLQSPVQAIRHSPAFISTRPDGCWTE